MLKEKGENLNLQGLSTTIASYFAIAVPGQNQFRNITDLIEALEINVGVREDSRMAERVLEEWCARAGIEVPGGLGDEIVEFIDKQKEK